jgi:hypothetical protein
MHRFRLSIRDKIWVIKEADETPETEYMIFDNTKYLDCPTEQCSCLKDLIDALLNELLYIKNYK